MDDEHLSETVRLEYRFLDLRRPQMQKNLRLRYRTAMAVRNFLDREGFHRHRDADAHALDAGRRARLSRAFARAPRAVLRAAAVAAAVQAAADDRGLRPLLPDRQVLPRRGPARRPAARVHADRYRNVVPQRRRRSSSSWKSSCARCSRTCSTSICRTLFRAWATTRRWRYTARTSRILRIALTLTELTDLLKNVEFKVFRDAAQLKGGRVAALRVPGGGALTRGEIDGYTEFVKIYGARGPRLYQGECARQRRGRSAVADTQVPVAGRHRADPRAHGARDGDLVFFGADKAKVVNDALGALRLKIGHERGLAESGWRPLWVLDFPMFEWDEQENRWSAMHHPFTSPADGHEDLLETDPGARARESARHRAERLGNRRRLGAHPSPGRAVEGLSRAQHQRRGSGSESSASCSRRCNTARRRTAASRSASIAWSR